MGRCDVMHKSRLFTGSFFVVGFVPHPSNDSADDAAYYPSDETGGALEVEDIHKQKNY
mgnify:CR=1 FL=1